MSLLVNVLKTLFALSLVTLCIYSVYFRLENKVSCTDKDGTEIDGPPPIGYAYCAWNFALYWKSDNNTVFHIKTQYSGNWIEGIKHGPGTFTSASGSVYKGEWQRDKRHGKGEMVLSNKHVISGEWKDDVLTCKKGSVIMSFVDESGTSGDEITSTVRYNGPLKDAVLDGSGTVLHKMSNTKIKIGIKIKQNQLEAANIFLANHDPISISDMVTNDIVISSATLKIEETDYIFKDNKIQSGNSTDVPQRVLDIQRVIQDYNKLCSHVYRNAYHVRSEPYHFPSDIEKQFEKVKETMKKGSPGQQSFEKLVNSPSSADNTEL